MCKRESFATGCALDKMEGPAVSSTITSERQERNSGGILLLMRGGASAKDYSNAKK
jgi:hypothetical protein